MSAPGCDRAWEAEALEDGRLRGELRASFERHLEGCATCRAELRALTELRVRGAAMQEPPLPELDRRRMRANVIAAANRQLLTPPRRRGAWLAAAAFAAVVALFVLVRVTRVSAPEYAVTDLGLSRWAVADAGPTTRLVLSAGTVRIDVAHLRRGQRFVLTLPDGELEVKGTSFVVRIVDGATDSVDVTSGVVALRVDGIEHLLAAGAHWQRAVRTASVAPPSAAPSSVPQAGSVEAPARPVPSSPTLSKSALAKPLAAPAPPTSAAAPATTSDFVDGMQAFKAGDYERADAAFARFIAGANGDTRVEDATFLRAACASRRGDRATAAARAREYLARWPNGFHAADAKKLVAQDAGD